MVGLQVLVTHWWNYLRLGSFEYVHGGEHLGSLGGKLDLYEAGVAGVVRGDVSKGNNMAWSGRKSSGHGTW